MKEFGIFAVIIMASSYAAFFYFQEESRQQIKLQLLEEQRQRQLESTDKAASHIGSDLTLILSMLDGISNSKYLQDDQFYGAEVKELATEKYSQMNKIVDKLFILNDEDIVVFGASNSSTNTLTPAGNDLSFRPWVKETRISLQPVFSEGFEAVGEYRVFITSPIIDRETRQYQGLVGASVPTVRFFEHYGNVHDINSQFLVAFDKKGILLAVGASQELVGLDYFGNVVQEFVKYNPTLNSHTSQMLEGKTGFTLYDYGRGERLMTYRPIIVADQPTYFLQVVTPTASIYSQLEPILSRESGKLTLFLAVSIAASAALVFFLLFWNSSLRKEVMRRTIDLRESNKLLADINEELKQRDHLQKEFINVAAHEMRTPIQPILGMSGMIKERIANLDKQFDEHSYHPGFVTNADSESAIVTPSTQIMNMLDVIDRNAKRLDKLSDNLLDLSRIENKSLKLNKEIVTLNEKINNAIIDANSSINTKKNVEIIFEPSHEPIFVQADKPRLFEVLSNLIYNAVKFTNKGTITVRSEKHDGYAIVSIKDTGTGIDREIMPRLFTKFATKSEKGMGLGLYISKNIVEAHGGKIWAQNNSDGIGATFAFTLPIDEPAWH